ncbi:hypothetical protein KVV02_000163 [Mortierella alpina]|uniref:Vacuolar membrane protein n=1 Tax=Mortierella alpina TaxID=64518 RepID=A0A9P8A157_MORAP|nr:hypothetical protein KVV02_000163 [Mortierella alpina]
MSAHWKREKVQDHKFDFINVDDFIDNSCWRQFRYTLVFAAIIRGILVYCSDIFTAVNLLTNGNSSSFVDKKGVDLAGIVNLPLNYFRYIFTGCIIFGFLLLALEMRRAKGIVASKDISYAFTSQIASRYYTVRSYPHYCLFAQIHNSKKTVDEVAFFCFFTFRNWKRLILADSPRQVINAFILYQTFKPHANELFAWNKIFDGNVYKMISVSAMIFTVVMCAMSLLMLVAAAVLYIPLVSHIRGNLKEYCCHKIDKRIDELIRKNTKSRADAALSGKNKDIAMSNLKQPTLPQLDLLEAGPTLPAQTPRNAYAQAQSPYPRNANVSNGQQGYGYSQAMYNNPSPQQPGYTQNYSKDDYFQAKPLQGGQSQRDPAAFDPYAESAFTTEDAYDAYNSNQDQQHLQQKPRHDMYGDYYGGSNVGSQQRQAPATRTPRRFDDYSSQQRSASPSQHGSDLDSNVNGSSGHGYGSNQGYGNEYYPSNGQQAGSVVGYSSPPPRPRRNDTAQSRGTPRPGFM